MSRRLQEGAGQEAPKHCLPSWGNWERVRSREYPPGRGRDARASTQGGDTNDNVKVGCRHLQLTLANVGWMQHYIQGTDHELDQLDPILSS